MRTGCAHLVSEGRSQEAQGVLFWSPSVETGETGGTSKGTGKGQSGRWEDVGEGGLAPREGGLSASVSGRW